MRPLNLTQIQNPDGTRAHISDSVQIDLHTPSDNTIYIFSDWKLISTDISLYERILLSMLSVSFVKIPSGGDLNSYLSSLSEEARAAFKSHAQQVLSDYDRDLKSRIAQENIQAIWVEAARYGIRADLDEFTRKQSESFNLLNQFIRKSTSWQTQFISAFLVAIALSILVTLIRPVTTLYDEIKSVTSSSQATAPPSPPPKINPSSRE